MRKQSRELVAAPSVRGLTRGLAALVLTACMTTLVFAQDAAAPVADGKGWTLPYALVVLCIILGMLPVCRPSRREDPMRMKYQ